VTSGYREGKLYSRYNLVCFYCNYIFIASHEHSYIYVLLCIENEEEVVVEEETAPQAEIPPVENVGTRSLQQEGQQG
jgi:hypothetical protein